MKPMNKKTKRSTTEAGAIQAIQDIPKGNFLTVLEFDDAGDAKKDLTTLQNGQKAVVSILEQA